MRVLIVNDYGTATGGAERMMLALRDGLNGHGHVKMFLIERQPSARQPA